LMTTLEDRMPLGVSGDYFVTAGQHGAKTDNRGSGHARAFRAKRGGSNPRRQHCLNAAGSGKDLTELCEVSTKAAATTGWRVAALGNDGPKSVRWGRIASRMAGAIPSTGPSSSSVSSGAWRSVIEPRILRPGRRCGTDPPADRDRETRCRDRCWWRAEAPQGALVKAEFGMIHRASSSSPGSARLLPTASWRAHSRPPACAAPVADPTD